MRGCRFPSPLHALRGTADLRRHPSASAPVAAQSAELYRRLAELERDPEAGESWPVLRARIEQRLDKAGRSVRLVVRHAAEADITEAVRWYEQRSPGLGSQFLRAVNVALAENTPMPERYPLVSDKARRVRLRCFPCAVFFVAKPDLVSVLAYPHVRRDLRRRERMEADG